MTSKLSNDPMALIAKYEIASEKHDREAQVSRFVAAWLLCEAFQRGTLTLPSGATFGDPIAWGSSDATANHAKIARAAYHQARGIEVLRGEAARLRKDYASNPAWTDKIKAAERKERNATANADATFTAMQAMRLLSHKTGADPAIDSVKGKAALPAAWWVPLDAADRKAHDALGDLSPWAIYLEPTATREKGTVGFLRPGNIADHAKAVVEHAKAKGDPKKAPVLAGYRTFRDDFSVTATGLSALLIERDRAAKAIADAANKPKAADGAAANGNGSNSNGAKPDGTITSAPGEEGGTGSQPAPQTASAPQTDQRAPQQPAPALPALVLALTAAWRAASGEDHKQRFSGAAAAEWRTLADHVWLNPHLAEIFLAAREETLKRQEAEKREGSKAA